MTSSQAQENTTAAAATCPTFARRLSRRRRAHAHQITAQAESEDRFSVPRGAKVMTEAYTAPALLLAF
ncbi:hypothetical protein DHEL01_v205819 [Diaporthe helianthi]|uniref:Uncharacterized protein n=1 Tax=Diaporthe helianthi TaxID=158607 RepID=A0A2P5HZW6_DIAHE|nr:hypothetical protein DHEL01_v205819 [Diaporthe helianthi]